MGKLLAASMKMGVLMHKPNREDLKILANMVIKGTIKLVIDDVLPLEQVPEALQKIGGGGVKGKMVISILD